MHVAHSSLIVLSFANHHKRQVIDIPSSWQAIYKTDFILIPFASLVLRFSWNMFSIHLPHRNQRYECAYGIQRMLICDYLKPQRGERCIKPTNVFHAINASCRIRVWYSAFVRKPNLPDGTQRTNYPGNPIILVQTKAAFHPIHLIAPNTSYPGNPGSDK